jgi:hypothetical protein
MIFYLRSFRKNCRPLPGVNLYICILKMILIIIFNSTVFMFLGKFVSGVAAYWLLTKRRWPWRIDLKEQ